MAKFSMKRGGKEVGPASVYAKPHTAGGQEVKGYVAGVESQKKYLRETPVNVANTRSDEYPPTKTSGIKIRGTGAATKGTMARGPMA